MQWVTESPNKNKDFMQRFTGCNNFYSNTQSSKKQGAPIKTQKLNEQVTGCDN